jgi:DUF4097 and DUF4098 domain-containing protein YvlB
MCCSPKALLLGGLLVLAAAPAFAQSEDCLHRRDLTARLEMSPGTPLRLTAQAGSLEVRGVVGLREARIRGTVCASHSDLAEQASVRTDSEAGAVIVETVIPDIHDRYTSGVSLRIDLTVEVPAGTPATVQDASGSAQLSNLGDVEVHDASGDLEIADVSGAVEVRDASGRLEIRHASGHVEVHDGSGDIIIRDVGGDVRIHDGSGSIDVDGMRGNLVVSEDGSGAVDYANVSGRVDIPRRGRGRHR